MTRYELLKEEFEQDIAEYRIEFNQVVPIINAANWSEWFRLHPELTTAEHAAIADRKVCSIYYWLRKLGLHKTTNRKKYTRYPIAIVRQQPPKPPADWDNRWIAEQYQAGFSCRQLATAVNRQYRAIYDRLQRTLKIIRTNSESKRSKSPYATKEWLSEHYVNQHLTLTQCAKLSNMGICTVRDWLINFGIRIRDSAETANEHNDMAKEPNSRIEKPTNY